MRTRIPHYKPLLLRSIDRISCCAFKLYVEGGQDAHPTRGKIYFTMRFKCGLAYDMKWQSNTRLKKIIDFVIYITT